MKRVFIDPGHGGKDRANRGPTGYVEADGALAIGKHLKDELLSTGAIEVKMSREVDAFIELRERARMAAAFKADLFISEHTNANDTKCRGSEAFYSVDLKGDEPLAAKIAKGISTLLGIPNRGSKSRENPGVLGEDYYAVIDEAQDLGIAHVILVESAFHDNPQDEALLKQDAILKKIAQVQAKCICEVLGVQYPAVSKPQPTVKFLTPSNCTIVAGSPVTITGAGVNCDHVGLFVNGAYKTSQKGNAFNYGLTFATPGTYALQLKGRNTLGETDPGTVLAPSEILTIKVLAPKKVVAVADINKINDAIKTLTPYFNL